MMFLIKIRYWIILLSDQCAGLLEGSHCWGGLSPFRPDRAICHWLTELAGTCAVLASLDRAVVS